MWIMPNFSGDKLYFDANTSLNKIGGGVRILGTEGYFNTIGKI